MAVPRSQLLDLNNPGWVHCVSRCVRRAFLAGDGFAHRQQWIEDRLRELSGVFGCQVAAYAVMANHVHVVLRMAPEQVAGWSDQTVAERWCRVFGKRVPTLADGVTPEPAWIAARVENPAWIAERRSRLGNLSWFMRALCEDIARRANLEDDCTGRFWEGRFRSIPILDQAGLVACMAYVDLNPIRAAIAERPERSPHTGVRLRVRARQRQRLGERLRQRGADTAETQRILRVAGLDTPPPEDPEAGQWLARAADCVHNEQVGPRQRLSLDEYLTLVDATGRALRSDKRGQIPAHLAPILARLDLSLDAWLAAVSSHRGLSRGSAIGTKVSRALAATARGLRWVRNCCALFAATPDGDVTAA